MLVTYKKEGTQKENPREGKGSGTATAGNEKQAKNELSPKPKSVVSRLRRKRV